mmetsp:Transcript_110472/g.219635  ORF Transcript_110472/g.219635 Transcript_110472/m.219635 type:complete len:200 (-) Transcript_110472:746-1345(-)
MKSDLESCSPPLRSSAAIAKRHSLPRPSSPLIITSHCSTSALVMTLPSLLQWQNAFSNAANIAGVKFPSGWTILASMFAARIVEGGLPTKASSAASTKLPTFCDLTFEVTCRPACPFSVGSPDSRKSGPTLPRTKNSRTADDPCELKSPQNTTAAGLPEASSPDRLRSFTMASKASWTCLRRRSAEGPADRWAFTINSV